MVPADTSWRNGRAVGAPWTFGIEPDAVHQNPEDLKNANAVVIPWITAVLRQRLPTNGNGLRNLTDADGWLVNIDTGEAVPAGAYPGAKREANWVPDEQSAQGWRVVTGLAK